ncbi:MAG: CheR family methyltransferase [Pseudobdellovibrio sp.]
MSMIFTPSDLNRLARIITEETGNRVDEKNFSTVEARFRSRIIQLRLKSVSEYWTHFSKNEKEERLILQSVMTTHYTFFFREFIHFKVLDNWINEEKDRLHERFKKTGQPVRIWSAACSRGQEVYSLAMFLELSLFKKHGIPFEILGTDLDRESIAYAKNGVYPLKEVITIPQTYLNNYWRGGRGSAAEFAVIHPQIKARTTFVSQNLLDFKKIKESQQVDVLFCRNVFIYFSEDIVKKIQAELIAKVEPRGLFISGISEPVTLKSENLSVVGPSCSQIAPPAKKVATDSRIKSGYKILCVDDSPTIRTLLKKIFSEDSRFTQVDLAADGREAREKMNLCRYDLVTLDIHMPGVNGIEFLETLYKKESDPPVLMISSINRGDADLAKKALALGAFDYVEKPQMNNLKLSTDEILSKVNMALLHPLQPSGPLAQNNFEGTFVRKLTEQDSDQCFRLLCGTAAHEKDFVRILQQAESETRSPAMLILGTETELNKIRSLVTDNSSRPVEVLNETRSILKPNHFYLIENSMFERHIELLRNKRVSLQILDRPAFSLNSLQSLETVQVILSESMGHFVAEFEKESNLKVYDIIPSMSFMSLSYEYFIQLRKAVA